MDKKKVLLVDDEVDTLLVLAKQLTTEGFIVVTANCGTQALNSAESEQPDLIVLDINMPDIDGGEVAFRLKQNLKTKDIPVIYSTCLLSENEQYQYGGNVMLAKTKNTKEVIAVIKDVLSI
jgi:two-component system cell cycle response regulator